MKGGRNMHKLYDSKAFTLIEILVAITISGMLAFFVYTMMIYSYQGYSRLNSVSKNSNSFRSLILSLQNSMKYADDVSVVTDKIVFERYDKLYNDDVQETYYFNSGNRIMNKSDYVINLSTNLPCTAGRGLLYKDVRIKGSGVLKSRILMSNSIRNIYCKLDKTAPNKYIRLTLGIMYDDVIDGKIQDDGSIVENNNNMTEVELRIKKLCFMARKLI